MVRARLVGGGADRPRPEAGAGAVRRRDVERRADDGDVRAATRRAARRRSGTVAGRTSRSRRVQVELLLHARRAAPVAAPSGRPCAGTYRSVMPTTCEPQPAGAPSPHDRDDVRGRRAVLRHPSQDAHRHPAVRDGRRDGDRGRPRRSADPVGQVGGRVRARAAPPPHRRGRLLLPGTRGAVPAGRRRARPVWSTTTRSSPAILKQWGPAARDLADPTVDFDDGPRRGPRAGGEPARPARRAPRHRGRPDRAPLRRGVTPRPSWTPSTPGSRSRCPRRACRSPCRGTSRRWIRPPATS